jgi:hypothetical protein
VAPASPTVACPFTPAQPGGIFQGLQKTESKEYISRETGLFVRAESSPQKEMKAEEIVNMAGMFRKASRAP